MLIGAELMARENKRVQRALKEAKLRLSQASVEGLDYPARRERSQTTCWASPSGCSEWCTTPPKWCTKRKSQPGIAP
jgi:hypothetical protein